MIYYKQAGGDDVEFLGDRIRLLRERTDYKQKYLAEHFNVSENTWSQYENNKRTPDTEVVKAIAEFFKVSMDYLFAITDEIYDPREEEFQELMNIYRNLGEFKKKQLISFAKTQIQSDRR